MPFPSTQKSSTESSWSCRSGGKGQGQPAARSNAVHFTLLSPGENEGESAGEVFTSETIQPEDDFVVVVRPDTYIGYVGQGNGWEDYLAQIFVR